MFCCRKLALSNSIIVLSVSVAISMKYIRDISFGVPPCNIYIYKGREKEKEEGDEKKEKKNI